MLMGDSGFFLQPRDDRETCAAPRAATESPSCARAAPTDPYKGCHRSRPDRIIRYLLAPAPRGQRAVAVPIVTVLSRDATHAPHGRALSVFLPAFLPPSLSVPAFLLCAARVLDVPDTSLNRALDV